MHYGYVFTKEALAGEPGVEVRGWWAAEGGGLQRSLGVAAGGASVVDPACTLGCWPTQPPPGVQAHTRAPHRPHLLQVVQCERSQLDEALRGADAAVPLMSRLHSGLLRAAERLKLVIQYGVGVEAIDIPTVRGRCAAGRRWCGRCARCGWAGLPPVHGPACLPPLRGSRPAAPLLPAHTRALALWQATELGVWVSNIPSHGTGNAISCAE